MSNSVRASLVLLLLSAAYPAQAQTVLAPHYSAALDPALTEPADAASAAALPVPKYGRWVTYGKWISLASAIGFGVAGALVSDDANTLYLQLEVICNAEPDACIQNPDGSYQNPVLENMFQTVEKKDQQARTAFVIAEVSFLASVTLFVVDFMRGGAPENKPYDPDEGERSLLDFSVVPGEVALRYYVQ